jgi:hypothetical protein
MSLKDCLQQAEVSRGIYFRKVHIRLTDTELQAQLLSHVEAMWTGQGHRGSNAVRHTPCGGSKAGHKKAGGGKRQRRGSGKGSGTGQVSVACCQR